jgi:protein ImuB
MNRIASVRVDVSGTAGPMDPSSSHQLATALLAGSPRIALAGPGLCRVDARGWGRRGGEVALAGTLREAATTAGFSDPLVGIADVAVAADAASRLAAGSPHPHHPGILHREEGALIVAPGAEREFLAPLPLSILPLPEEFGETLRALGFRWVGDLAGRERGELEARFGPEGSRAHRLACGEDGRLFRPIEHRMLPDASLELEGITETLEPLLFVLRHLLDRVCMDLSRQAVCAARLSLELCLADGDRKSASVIPARPTRNERLLYDLCRASLVRAAKANGRLSAPVAGLALQVEESASPGVRQGDLFAVEWRDPMAAAAALSRLRARIGDDGVVLPCPLPDNRPETRNAWRRAEVVPAAVRERSLSGRSRTPRSAAVSRRIPIPALTPGSPPLPMGREPFSSVLRLLPEPVTVRVRTEEGRLVEVENAGVQHRLVAAEGPERLSGDWWKDPYHREYFRVCTTEGELLWLFREYRRRSGELRWYLHGWWD